MRRHGGFIVPGNRLVRRAFIGRRGRELTATRKGELVRMEWKEIDLKTTIDDRRETFHDSTRFSSQST